jgi:hypothetical protein
MCTRHDFIASQSTGGRSGLERLHLHPRPFGPKLWRTLVEVGGRRLLDWLQPWSQPWSQRWLQPWSQRWLQPWSLLWSAGRAA